MIRDLDFDKQFFLYLINIASIILLPVTLYFYLVYDIDRIRIFTSSATVFSNISMTFFLFSLLSIYFFKKYKIDYIFLAYLGSFAAFFKTEVPLAKDAAIMKFSVAPTEAIRISKVPAFNRPLDLACK